MVVKRLFLFIYSVIKIRLSKYTRILLNTFLLKAQLV